jgi:Mrr N-terminal domain
MQKIFLSDLTYKRLSRHAIPFEDHQPEDVIVRLLDQVEKNGGIDLDRDEPPRLSRAAPGSLLPLSAYWTPILQVLEEAGGATTSNDVLDALEERMGDMLTEKDREPLRSGSIRWRNRARFARLRMKERGLLSDSSQRGVWEITDDGRRYLTHSEQG